MRAMCLSFFPQNTLRNSVQGYSALKIQVFLHGQTQSAEVEIIEIKDCLPQLPQHFNP